MIDRSKSCMNTKLHAVTNGDACITHFFIAAGYRSATTEVLRN